VLPAEYPLLRTRSIDIVLDAEGGIAAAPLALLADEVCRAVSWSELALRGRHRWRPVTEAVRPAPAGARPEHSGHVLITGGLGGLGYAFARYLADRGHVALTLTGRQQLPPPAEWQAYLAAHAEDDDVGRRIRQLYALEQRGAQVSYFATDVTEEGAMNRLADQAVSTFGPLRGIFHAVGQAGSAALSLSAQGQGSAVMGAKLAGTAILAKVFDFATLDYVILCSSLNALAPFVGQADAAGADAFLDAMAQRDGVRGRVRTVNWSLWNQPSRLAQSLPKQLTAEGSAFAALMVNGIGEADAAAVFDAVLASRLPQLIVAPLTLRVTLERIAEINHALLNGAVSASLPGQTSTRPDMAVLYTPAENETEQSLVGIWQNLFGLAPIGIHDDFFDLGGHSLMATQVLAYVRKHWQVDLSLRDLFESTTIAALATQVTLAVARAETVRLEKHHAAKAMAQKSIDAMSPDEIAAMLLERKRLKSSKSAAD
jgi:NAD(P)-dependent dehydrogenase (short-subunit alcohol dehydrogenase family)